MTRRKKNKKKGMHPGVALLILGGTAAFVVPKLMGDDASSGIASLIGLDQGEDREIDEAAEAAAVVWVDLLAEHGSYDRQSSVRLAFAAAAESSLIPAAPGGEIAPDGERWTGSDPPLMRLGVVMVSEKSRRAVLGGSVVGVGDAVGGGQVISIEAGRLRLRWQERVLTYGLDDEVPQEFRAESKRRALEEQAAEAQLSEAGVEQETPVEGEGK